MNSERIIRFSMLGFFLVLLSSCDSGNEKSWSTKKEKQDPYRCGLLGPYEFKINKDYLFFWPTYEGRSDWENNSPPPTSCNKKISTIRMEVYFPEMLPAGRLPIENDPNLAHSSISINLVGKLDTWDLRRHLDYLLQQDFTKMESITERSKDIGLYHHRGRDSTFGDLEADYFWDYDGETVSLLIDCSPIKNGMATYCVQMQYMPSMHALIKTRYHSERLALWREISRQTIEFVRDHSNLKEQK